MTFSSLLYGQDNNFYMPDSLAVVKLSYETLDSNAINTAQPWINMHLRTIVCLNTDEGVKLAYYTTDKNRWRAFLLPFSRWTNNFDTCNLDKIGQPEIVIKGVIAEYGSRGGTVIAGMVIINIDSIPTQIFNVLYGCLQESFGDMTQNGETTSFQRTINIENRAIVISPLDKRKYPFSQCRLTEIPTGTYRMTGGQIRRK